MMAKTPPNLPSEGDRVKLRGYKQQGKLIKLNPQRLWCKVEWDLPVRMPEICHLYELEKIDC